MPDKSLVAETNNVTTFGGDERLYIVDDPGGTPADGYITSSQLVIWDGWTPVNESWAYASASTISVPTGAAARFQKGDRLRLKQSGGTYKYWPIYSVADTLITVIVSSDYTLANEAITDIAISRAANPFGWPGGFNYSPTLDGFSADPASSVYRFSTVGNRIKCTIRQPTPGGTSDDTIFTITAPCAAKTITNQVWLGYGTGTDNGSALTTMVALFINSASSTIDARTNGALAAWTNSGAKRIGFGSIEFEF